MEIIIGFSGICLGYVICLAWSVYTKNDLSFLDDKSAIIYPLDKPSPNRIFIERHADRRLPDQTWREQVARAYKVMPVNKPVIIPTHKNIIDEIDNFLRIEHDNLATRPSISLSGKIALCNKIRIGGRAKDERTV